MRHTLFFLACYFFSLGSEASQTCEGQLQQVRKTYLDALPIWGFLPAVSSDFRSTPDGRFLMVRKDERNIIWDRQTSKTKVASFSAAANPRFLDEKTLVWLSSERHALEFNVMGLLNGQSRKISVPSVGAKVLDFEFSRDQKKLFVMSRDKMLHWFDLDKNEFQSIYCLHCFDEPKVVLSSDFKKAFISKLNILTMIDRKRGISQIEFEDPILSVVVGAKGNEVHILTQDRLEVLRLTGKGRWIRKNKVAAKLDKIVGGKNEHFIFGKTKAGIFMISRDLYEIQVLQSELKVMVELVEILEIEENRILALDEQGVVHRIILPKKITY